MYVCRDRLKPFFGDDGSGQFVEEGGGRRRCPSNLAIPFFEQPPASFREPSRGVGFVERQTGASHRGIRQIVPYEKRDKDDIRIEGQRFGFSGCMR